MEKRKYKIDKDLFTSLKGGLVGYPFKPDHEEIYSLSELPFDLTDFLLEINGFAYNGIEIFTLAPGSLCEDDIGYCVPDIFSYLEQFRMYKPHAGENLLPVGKGDEDIFLYDYETNSYSINDSIDLMEYESFEDFISMFEHLLAERGYPVSFEIKS